MIKDHIESIGCTLEELKISETDSKIDKEEKKNHNDPEVDEDFFKQIDAIASSTTHKIGEKPLIIVDA
jgi:hypothetical protein